MLDSKVCESHSQFSAASEVEAKSSHPTDLKASAAILTAGVALSSCGGDDGATSTPGAPIGNQSSTPPQQVGITSAQRRAARSALHASLATSPAAIAAIERQGIEDWLDGQMGSQNDSSSKNFFEARGIDEINSQVNWQDSNQFDPMIWSQLFTGGNIVRKRMALALSEIFVVSISALDIVWPSQAVGYYWDTLNEFAFGNYRELLEAITLNPAMGVFLDTKGNEREDASTGRQADENYAREVLQLFSIGLYELNNDGSLKTSGGGPIETYDNDDVQGLARVFTGYDFDYTGVGFVLDPRFANRHVPEPRVVRQPMTPIPERWSPQENVSLHSLSEKKFLGTSIPAGTGPVESLKLALDTIFNHPNVGPFLSRRLIQRLVTSNPSPAYIARVANVFNNNGSNTRGDLGAVFKAIVTDDEATEDASVSNPFFGKLREPMLRFAQWGRTFGATSDSNSWSIRDVSDVSLLNQAPFRSPSVFNFFRPDFSPSMSQAVANNMVAPEFQIANESSVAAYVAFIRSIIDGPSFWAEDIVASYNTEIGLAEDAEQLLNHIDLVLTAGQLSDFSRSHILDAINEVKISDGTDEESKLLRVQVAVLLTMVCNDYMVQK